jgi:hypothetical protein
MTGRIKNMMDGCINQYQSGFLPHRFIAENGLALKLIMEQAETQGHEGVGMLLDQEKAYDRVHPTYMEQTLLHFGFPVGFTRSICNLFFGNSVKININGYFTEKVTQKRGLRQGDPLSPLLFNLAMEPLLLSILQDSTITGYLPCFSPQQGPQNNDEEKRFKLLAYADDICLFIANQNDFHKTQAHLQRYGQVSNAKLNVEKTEVFSLSGRALPQWQHFFAQHNINKWYDRSSPTPIRYIGFKMAQSPQQRNTIINQLLQNVTNAFNIYSQRQLSIRGRVTIANMLVLSKIWYQLRITPLPKMFYNKLQSITSKFVNKGFTPPISYTTLCQPVTKGGLGLLDGYAQTMILQYRWLTLVLTSDPPWSFSSRLLHHHLQLLPGNMIGHRLPFFFPQLRSGPLCTHQSFLYRLFQAYDSFPTTTEEIPLSINTWLRLPLETIINQAPPDHWTHKTHGKDPLSWYFCYDSEIGCLRPFLPNHSTTTPDPIRHRYLTAKLLREISNKVITLHSSIITHMTTWRQPAQDISDEPLVEHFTNQRHWYQFRPRIHRQHILQHQPPASWHPKIDITKWKIFWKQPLDPMARTTWYRLAHKKLLCQQLYSKFKDTTAACLFCPDPNENLEHLFIYCPRKWNVWEMAFQEILPQVPISHNTISAAVQQLVPPPSPSSDPSFLFLCSCIIQAIWRHHWLYVIHSTPFTTNNVKALVYHLFSKLRPSPRTYIIPSPIDVEFSHFDFP